jgi:hypothetical protein
MEYPQLKLGEDSKLWLAAASREIGRLAHGKQPDMPTGSNTMHFLDHRDLPAGRKATYLRIVAAIKMHKVETHRIRFTVGGGRIDYKGKVSTPTATLETIKILLNSTVSTPNAKMLTADIKFFYLGTPMDRYEYMRIPAKDIPANIMEQYNLAPLVHNSHVLTKIRKGMYGLSLQPPCPALGLSDYTPVKHTPGLFRHATRPVTFSLVVDDFAIKYVNRVNAEHLLATLRSLYNITTDWTASMYCGITLQWDYVARTVDLSMPGYIEKALETYLDKCPKRPQHAPHAWTAPSYGSKVQLTPPADNSEPLDAGGLTRIQRIIGPLLFYGLAINSTLLVALGTLSAAQSKGTAATAQAITQLLNYCATHPDATIRFIASKLHLHIHTDASYFRNFEPAPVQVATYFSVTSPRSFRPSRMTHRHLSMAPAMFTHPS